MAEKILFNLARIKILAAANDHIVQPADDIAIALGVDRREVAGWRKEYGGLKTDQARRMKDLEKENGRLRLAISDLTLDKLILQEAARGNF